MFMLKNELVEWCFSVYTSELYSIEFHLMEDSQKGITRPFEVSVLGAASYHQRNVHVENAYQGSFRSFTVQLPKAVKCLKWQQRNERPTMSTDVKSSAKSVLHRKVFECIEGSVVLMQPIWIVC